MAYRFIKKNKINKNTDLFVIKDGRFKDGKLDAVYRDDWAEDVYISDSGEKETVGKNFNYSKLPLIAVFFSLLFIVLLGKTAWLQVVKNEYYYEIAEGNRVRVERIEPKRGVIYDRAMRPLVRNQANFLLYLVPADLPSSDDDNPGELDSIFSRISELIPDLDIADLKNRLAGIDKYSLDSYQPLYVADNIQYDKAMMLYIESANWPGVVLTSKTNRHYLVYSLDNGEEAPDAYHSLSHILGYTGKINEDELEQYGGDYLPIDYIGKMGIEYFWENELKGVTGKKQIEVDALGKEKKIISQKSARLTGITWYCRLIPYAGQAGRNPAESARELG